MKIFDFAADFDPNQMFRSFFQFSGGRNASFNFEY